jgi:hypothetical protein
MRKIAAIILVGFTVCMQNAFGAPATSYSCVGKNKATGSAVVFDLLFADSAPGAGYTNQSITITKHGSYLDKPIILQMYGATKKNECQKNGDDEIYLSPGNFDMRFDQQSSMNAQIVIFKSACGGQDKFDVKAYCLFDY